MTLDIIPYKTLRKIKILHLPLKGSPSLMYHCFIFLGPPLQLLSVFTKTACNKRPQCSFYPRLWCRPCSPWQPSLYVCCRALRHGAHFCARTVLRVWRTKELDHRHPTSCRAWIRLLLQRGSTTKSSQLINSLSSWQTQLYMLGSIDFCNELSWNFCFFINYNKLAWHYKKWCFTWRFFVTFLEIIIELYYLWRFILRVIHLWRLV